MDTGRIGTWGQWLFLAILMVTAVFTLSACGEEPVAQPPEECAVILPAEPVANADGDAEETPAVTESAAADPPEKAEPSNEATAPAPTSKKAQETVKAAPETPKQTDTGQHPASSTPPAKQEEAAPACTLSISCATVLENQNLCAPELLPLLPADGWLLAETSVPIREGDSVFTLLLRACREKGIPMEYTDTPLYDSAYIEGIGGLYEFDVGELSGWTYSVNGRFPNIGCSLCDVKDGDVVAWIYTCDLGRDIDAADG